MSLLAVAFNHYYRIGSALNGGIGVVNANDVKEVMAIWMSGLTTR